MTANEIKAIKFLPTEYEKDNTHVATYGAGQIICMHNELPPIQFVNDEWVRLSFKDQKQP